MLSGWSHRGRWDGRGMWHVRREEECVYDYEGRSYCYVSADMTSLDLNCLTLKVKALRSVETSGTACQRTHHNIPEYWNLQEPHISQTCLTWSKCFSPFCLHFMLVLWEGRAGGVWETSKQSDVPSPASAKVTVCVASRLRYPDAYSSLCFVSFCLSLVRHLGGDRLETFRALKFPLFP